MKLVVHRSTPLRPIASSARQLSEHCDELWIATAFVSENAIADIVGPAVAGTAKIRFLTGTFGHVTRLRTFKRLWRWSQQNELEARIWPGDFHAKLILWRKGATGHCWIGSANLTDRGLQEEGEIVAEVSGRWHSPRLRALRNAFEAEWTRGTDLDQTFLRKYREAPRVGKLLKGQSTSRAGSRKQLHRKRAPSRRARSLLVLPVTRYYDQDGAAVQRIVARLGGTAENWYRSGANALRFVRPGQHCLIVDGLGNTLALVVVTDTARDGKGYVLAYEPFTKSNDRNATKTVRSRLIRLGLKPTSMAFRTKWLGPAQAGDIVEAIYGRPVRLRVDRALGVRS